MSGGFRDDVKRINVSCTRIMFLCLIFLVSCPFFVDKCICDAEREVGVQNPHRGGADAPLSPFLEALSHAASEACSSLIGLGGCIVILYLMSCPLAKITMIFFANFLYWKENRGFAANNKLGIF